MSDRHETLKSWLQQVSADRELRERAEWSAAVDALLADMTAIFRADGWPKEKK